MSKSDPIVEDIVWCNNTIHYDKVSFSMLLNPNGLQAILDIDPTVYVSPWFDHMVAVKGVLHKEGMFLHHLSSVEGFRQFVDFMDQHYAITDTAYKYRVDCRIDSPLVAWFLVLGAKDERSSDTRRRHEQILNDLG